LKRLAAARLSGEVVTLVLTMWQQWGRYFCSIWNISPSGRLIHHKTFQAARAQKDVRIEDEFATIGVHSLPKPRIWLSHRNFRILFLL
jgi:hypothetical protein